MNSISDPGRNDNVITDSSYDLIGVDSIQNPYRSLKKEDELPYDFEHEVLNEDGRKIYQALIGTYSGVAPKTLVFMIRALSDLKLIELDFKTAPNSAKWARTFNHYFGKESRQYIPKSIFEAINRTKGNLHEEYNNQIRKEVLTIKRLLDNIVQS